MRSPTRSHQNAQHLPVDPALPAPYDLSIDLPYSLIEADAVFHNVSLEVVIRRYLAAKLREGSDAT